jgi:hypothetical protein
VCVNKLKIPDVDFVKKGKGKSNRAENGKEECKRKMI